MRTIASCIALAAVALAAPVQAQTREGQAPANTRTSAADEKIVSTTAMRVPNFLGATGLLYTPSAYLLGRSNFSAYFNGNSDFVGGGVLAGIGDRLELGLTIAGTEGRRRSFFDNNGTQFLANAKLNIITETDKRPALSIGVIDAFSELKDDASWYVVASKYFTRMDTDQKFALKGNVGYGGGIYDRDPFAGAELVFNQRLSAMAEIQNGDFNVGVRGRYKGFSGTVGLFDVKHFGGGISYTASFR